MSEQPVEKVGYLIPVGIELYEEASGIRGLFTDILLNPPPPLSPEQIAARQRECDEHNTRQRQTWERLMEAGGLVTKVAELHEPIDGYCPECSGEDAQDWPCGTAQALIDHLEKP